MNNQNKIENTAFSLLEKNKGFFSSLDKNFKDILKEIEDFRMRYNGNYDGMLAKISNFSWSFNTDGTYDVELTLLSWGDVIESHISDCNGFLRMLKADGSNIIGFGAAAKGCIFLNSAKIDNTILDVVIDDTDLKQDKFIPGTGIQIKSREYLKDNKVDYILILAHNFKDVIIESLKEQYGGRFIILFPQIKII
jgi:hypothetical protein